MTAKNDVTGDAIRSKVGSESYRNNYDAIFRKDKKELEKKEDQTCSSNRRCEKDCDGGCE